MPLDDLTWRPLTLADLAAIVELSQICYAADGGLGFLFVPEIIQSRYLPDGPVFGIGAFTPDGQLAACSSVYPLESSGVPRARIVGQVHPDLRGKGLGRRLIMWGQEQAAQLPAESGAEQLVLQVATESLTEAAHQLYLAHGYINVFDEFVMQRDLRQPVSEILPPADVTLAAWQPDLADQFFQAYTASFRERPGFPGYSAAEWIGGVVEDDLVPEWTLLARLAGEPVGFVIGDVDLTSDPPGGYINQVGVVPAQRRHGLASALLAESMRRMQAAGVNFAWLTVHLNNPGAVEAYARLGFQVVGRRARYEKNLEL
jgi:ribosomal protein S18 acetylase RimI-like enzyme